MAPAKRNHETDLPLPASIEAERFVLGSIVAGHANASGLIETLAAEDFSIEAHRRIFSRIRDIRERGGEPERLTVADELRRQGQLDSIGGLSYLVSLDEGLPEIVNLAAYAQIIREKSALRRQIFTYKAAMDRALMGDSATEIAASVGQALDGFGVGPRVESQSPEQIIAAYPGGVSAFLDPSSRKSGLPSPWPRLNETLGGGFREGELVVLAARPGVGKSAAMLNIASHLAIHPRRPIPVGIFSLEMTAASLITRMLCAVSRVDGHKFRAGFLNADERHKLHVGLDQIISAPLSFCDHFGITMPELAAEIRRGVKHNGWRAVFVDYLQLIGVKHKSENRNIELAQMTRQFKTLSKDYGIPIILLSQLSRANEKRPGDKRPILSDLRESGSIEQDSDTVIFIHREELYAAKDREDVKGLADLIVAKQRNGPMATVPLRFLGHFTRFESRSEDLLDIPEDDDGPPPAPPGPDEEW